MDFEVSEPVSVEIEIKKSRFIGQLYPVTTRAEAKAKLSELRAQHPRAVHVCWVLLCDGDSGLDDDGEPSGTAARPMYNVLTHKSIVHVLAVVVRYWGGIKLGAGGLARAYGQAISEACKLAQLKPLEPMGSMQIALPFSEETALRRLCDQMGAVVGPVQYNERAEFTLRLKVAEAERFLTALNQNFRQSELTPFVAD